MLARSKAPLILLAPAVLIAVIALLLHPIPQPLSYHDFADHRSWLGIPNFGDVASNLPFALIGVWGVFALLGSSSVHFVDGRERWLYATMFFSLILTSIGSAYYHLAPSNARLVWDRIPIMMVFMALLASVIAERIRVASASLSSLYWRLPVLAVFSFGAQVN